MNCKTCKHFNLNPDHLWEDTSGFGVCSRIASSAKLKTKEIDADGIYVITGYRTPDDEVFDDPVMTIDGSDYFSALKVKEDFGCVLWEAK